MTWLEKYDLLLLNANEAFKDAHSTYRMLALEKGYLNNAECPRYLELFDHYLSLRNEYDVIRERFRSGEIRSKDECEL
jgi:hypothetical protein